MYTFTNSFNKNHSKEGIPMNVFDILGPVMIGLSISHTAGAARIGRITMTLLGAPAVKAVSYTHLNSIRSDDGPLSLYTCCIFLPSQAYGFLQKPGYGLCLQ